ncbi:MAG: putative sulfate exporter family transporter [Mucinivorans sp.]
MFKKLFNEDWLATIAGLLIMLLAIILTSLAGSELITGHSSVPSMVIMPKNLDTNGDWSNLLLFFGGLFLITFVALSLQKKSVNNLFWSLSTVVALSFAANYIASMGAVKELTGLEGVFFAVAIGLLVSNTVGTPKWLKGALHSEFYVKIGLVLLGTTIIFSEIMTAGLLGMMQALIVILSVWGFAYWMARKFNVDREMSTMLASAVSICGVSAAIATAGAIKGDSKKLSYVISLVLVCAIPMMYIMPYVVGWLGLSAEVGGAWLGGTIDTTGAVVAAGSALGEVGEKYSVIVKSSQNVLLGFAALFISIYWTYKGKGHRDKASVGLLWERFPKFVLGFIVASLIFSFVLEAPMAKEVIKSTKNLQNALFSVAFVCIGLETRFKDIFDDKFSRPMYAFLIAQLFNIILTLIVASVLFGHILF